MTPQPRAAQPAATLDEAAQLRRLDCARYADCLDVAERSRWPGFQCGTAECYEEPSPQQRALELDALLELRAWVVSGGQ